VQAMNGVLEQLIHFSHGFVTQLRGTAQVKFKISPIGVCHLDEELGFDLRL